MSDIPPLNNWLFANDGCALALELALERLSRVADLVRCSAVSKAWADAVARSVHRVEVDCISGGVLRLSGAASVSEEDCDDGEFNNAYKRESLSCTAFTRAIRVFRQLTSLTVTSIQQAFGDAFLETLASSCSSLQTLDLSCMCYGEGDDEVTSSGLNSLFAGCPSLKWLSLRLGHLGSVGRVSTKRKMAYVLTTSSRDVQCSGSALMIPSSISLLSALEALEIQTDRCLVVCGHCDSSHSPDVGASWNFNRSDPVVCGDCSSRSCSAPSLLDWRHILPGSLTQLQLSSSTHHVMLPRISSSYPSHLSPMGSGLKSVALSVCCDVMVAAIAPLFTQELTFLKLSANHATECNSCLHVGGNHAPKGGSAGLLWSGDATEASKCSARQTPHSPLLLPTHLSLSKFHIVQAEGGLTCSPISLLPIPALSFPANRSAYSRLRSLHLNQCPNTSLPPSLFPSLARLTSLSVTHCRLLQTLPPTISLLSSLTSLHMHACHALDSLPPEALCLPALRALHATNCRRLASVGLACGNAEGAAGTCGDGYTSGPLAIREVLLWGCGGLSCVNWELLLWKTLQSSVKGMVEVNLQGCRELKGVDNVMHLLGRSSGRIVLPDGAVWNSKASAPCLTQAPERFSDADRCITTRM